MFSQNTSVLAGVAFAAGLFAGLVLRPFLPIGGTALPDRPSDAEATAALRAVINDFSKKPVWPNTTVRVGDCRPSPISAGIVCVTELKDSPQGEANVRSMILIRFDGVWKFTGWL